MKHAIKSLALFGLLVISLASSRSSYAEGGCPAGMYPIHSPGVMGCAPFPQAPGPRWATRWGAVASDTANVGPHGVSNNESSKRQAKRLAMERCRQGGSKKCKITAVYWNSCYFSAMPHDGREFLRGRQAFAWGGAADEAKALALRDCEKANGRTCQIEYSACALPVEVR